MEKYEWAGQIRRGDFLAKGSSIFCRGAYIIENTKVIFENIYKENNLRGLNRLKFIERLAYYMGEINALHPFREGNGRTAREFFRQLSLNANYRGCCKTSVLQQQPLKNAVLQPVGRKTAKACCKSNRLLQQALYI